MLYIAGGIRNAGGYVWAYNTELFFQAQDFTDAEINHFMSWIPLVGGSLGAVFGGFISDLLVKNRSTYVRIWVLIVSHVWEAILQHCRRVVSPSRSPPPPPPPCLPSSCPSNPALDFHDSSANINVSDLTPNILSADNGCSLCSWSSLPPLPMVLPLTHPFQFIW